MKLAVRAELIRFTRNLISIVIKTDQLIIPAPAVFKNKIKKDEITH